VAQQRCQSLNLIQKAAAGRCSKAYHFLFTFVVVTFNYESALEQELLRQLAGRQEYASNAGLLFGKLFGNIH